MNNPRPFGMTSTEAAALYLSNGKTADPRLAEMYDVAEKQPELLLPRGVLPMKDYQPPALVIDDPEEAERLRLGKALGVDVDTKIDFIKMRAVFKDKDGCVTRCKLSDDPETAAVEMSRAMVRLKTKHEAKELSNESV